MTWIRMAEAEQPLALQSVQLLDEIGLLPDALLDVLDVLDDRFSARFSFLQDERIPEDS